VDADIAGKLHRLGVRHLEPVEVNARLDFHAAAGDAQVDGNARPEFQRGFNFPYAFRSEAQREKAAAAQEGHGQIKGAFPLTKVEFDERRVGIKRQRKSRA